jgi:hypothetical protein
VFDLQESIISTEKHTTYIVMNKDIMCCGCVGTCKPSQCKNEWVEYPEHSSIPPILLTEAEADAIREEIDLQGKWLVFAAEDNLDQMWDHAKSLVDNECIPHKNQGWYTCSELQT